MFKLSNGHEVEYVVASGALAYDGRGWPWERLLCLLGLIKLKSFSLIVAKTVTFDSLRGNLRWYKPLECIKLLPDDGAINKVGLTNPGFELWWNEVGQMSYQKRLSTLVSSIYGTPKQLGKMAYQLNFANFFAVEVNTSCPNTGHMLTDVEQIVEQVKTVKDSSDHPVIAKLSVVQDYVAIAKRLVGVAEAVSLNSVPWELAYPNQQSPLWRLEKKVGGGGGGVSGQPAQALNWKAVEELAREVPEIPVIAPSIMEYEDLNKVRALGAKAVSFGALFLRRPWAPTRIVRKDMARKLARESQSDLQNERFAWKR